MLTLFSFFFCFLFGFSSFIYFYHLGVWDLKLSNPKLGDRPQLWPVLSPSLYALHFLESITSISAVRSSLRKGQAYVAL